MNKVNKILGSQKTFAVLIALFLGFLPLLYGMSTGMLIALLAISLASLRYHKPEFNKALLLPVLFYILMAASLFWTDHLNDSARGLERQMALVLIPLAFVCMPTLTMKTRNLILYWFSIAMMVFALLFMGAAFVDFLQSRSLGTFFYHRLVAPLDLNAIYISVFVSLCILFLLFTQKKTRLSIIALVVLSVFLLLLASKSIIVATGLLSVFGIFRSFKRSTILKFLPFLALGLALLIFTSNPVRKRFEREITVSNVKEVFESERFNKVYDWTGTTLRLFQARIFTEMLEEDAIFLTGYGINNSKEKIIEKQKQYNLWQGYYTYNFHNQYIQAFAELGIFGLLCVFLLLGVILRQYIRGKDLLFLSLFFIMFVVFMTESYLWRQRGLYHFLILYCLLFKSIPSLKAKKTNET